MGSSRVDYRDKDGIRRRVLLPTNQDSEPEEGIPISLPVDCLYEHMPLTFRISLIDALWDVGLIEPGDYFRPGAPELIRAALLSVVRHDTLDILALAKSERGK